MLNPEMASFATVAALAAVHFFAGTKAALQHQWRPRALSTAAGISVCYLFLDLLPDLADRQVLIETSSRIPIARLMWPPSPSGLRSTACCC
jgi:hypothetical protein